MGKKNATPSAPVLTVVPPVEAAKKREARFVTFTVKVAAGLVFDAVGILKDAATSGRVEGTVFPFASKSLKSGRVSVVIGKTNAGRPKLTAEQKAAKKAEREKFNATAKNLRKQMRTNPIMAAFAEKLANGQKLSAEESAQLIALVS